MSHIDRCTAFHVSGWAVREGAPAEAIEVSVNGERIATIRCDEPRPDLASHGLPDRAGFGFRFPHPVSVADAISLRFADGTPLRNSPLSPQRYDGHLDACTRMRVEGWAVDDARPAVLNILVAGEPVAKIHCDRPRPDLLPLCGPGDAGFEYFFARPLGPTEEVLVCFTDGTPLPGSPCYPEDQVRPARMPARASRITIVIGMHRSGTSLCANVLNTVGIEMSEVIGVTAYNQLGHWEHPAITSFHDRLLGSLGRSWDDPLHALPLPPGWLSLPSVRAIRDEMIEWVRRRRDVPRNLGFKDPRATRLLPLWFEICGALELEPELVLCVRSPMQVARSLVARDGSNWQEAAFRWLIYNVEAVLGIAELSVCIIPYEAWFEDPRGNLERLARHLGPDWGFTDPAVARVVRHAIDPALRHDAEAGEASTILQEFHADLLGCARVGRFDRRTRDRAADFAAFASFVQPFLVRAGAAAPSPGQRAVLPDTGEDPPYPASKLRLAQGIVGTIRDYSEALRQLLGDMPAFSDPGTGADPPD